MRESSIQRQIAFYLTLSISWLPMTWCHKEPSHPTGVLWPSFQGLFIPLAESLHNSAVLFAVPCHSWRHIERLTHLSPAAHLCYTDNFTIKTRLMTCFPSPHSFDVEIRSNNPGATVDMNSYAWIWGLCRGRRRLRWRWWDHTMVLC